MKASRVVRLVSALPPDADVLVRDASGRWTFVEDVDTSSVRGDGAEPPSHLVIRGRVYVAVDA